MVFLWLNQVISLALPSIPVMEDQTAMAPRCWGLHVSSVDWLTTPCPLEKKTVFGEKTAPPEKNVMYDD